jgi:hypothetical protein
MRPQAIATTVLLALVAGAQFLLAGGDFALSPGAKAFLGVFVVMAGVVLNQLRAIGSGE